MFQMIRLKNVVALSAICCIGFSGLYAEELVGNQPSSIDKSADYSAGSNTVVYVETDMSTPGAVINADNTFIDAVDAVVKEDTGKKEEQEPVLEPMVLAGTGAAVAGAGVAVAGMFAAPILLAIGALLLIASALLTSKGWKKIKAEPKKYKGEKFAIANFIIIGVLGVAASFYALYLLFMV